jgi:hypothetical protein
MIKEPGNIFVFMPRTGKVIGLLLKNNEETDTHTVLVLTDEDKTISHYETGSIVTFSCATNKFVYSK